MDFAIADGKLFSCSCERGMLALIEPFSASKSNLTRRESLKLSNSRRGEALRSFYYLLPHTHTKVKAQLDSAVSDVLLMNTCACQAISTTSTEWGGATVSVVPKFVGGNSMKNPTPPV